MPEKVVVEVDELKEKGGMFMARVGDRIVRLSKDFVYDHGGKRMVIPKWLAEDRDIEGSIVEVLL